MEDYLKKQPELIERFREQNRDLLNSIKERFMEFNQDSDVISKYLLTVALVQIMAAVSQKTKEEIAQHMREQGLNIIDIPVVMN